MPSSQEGCDLLSSQADSVDHILVAMSSLFAKFIFDIFGKGFKYFETLGHFDLEIWVKVASRPYKATVVERRRVLHSPSNRLVFPYLIPFDRNSMSKL